MVTFLHPGYAYGTQMKFQEATRVSWPRRIFGVISHKILQLEFSKQSLSHFWVKTRNECPVISDLATHNFRLLHSIHEWNGILKIEKSWSAKSNPFWKMLGMHFVLRCLASIYEWISCVKIIKYFHSINFQNLNCFLLIFSSYSFHYVVVLLPCRYLRE